MTSSWARMQNKVGRAVIAAGLLTIYATHSEGVMAAATDQPAASYTWSAELVSFDAASRMVTLKSRIEEYADVKGLDELMKGDPITLEWTGMTWGAGIRNVVRGHDASAPGEALVLPAEYVGTELNDQYVTYRLAIPAASVSKIQALKPGDWVTATSPRHGSDPAKAVVEMHGFNDAS